MPTIIKRYRKDIFFSVVLIVLYLASRLFRLTLIPIFTDEAIYIRWAQIARYDAAWRFIPLSDGKQPLYVWLMMTVIPYIKDPLFAGRLVSILAGLGTMTGLFFLGWLIFKNRRIGFITAGLYLFYPFAFVYDRMALMDGLVGMFCVWSLLFEIFLVETLRLDVALILGMIIGGGMLTKTSGFFNLYLLPFSLLLFDWRNKKRTQNLLLWLILASVAAIEAMGMYQILHLSPLFSTINEKNTVFVYPLKEWLQHPWRFLEGNLSGLWDWFKGYFSWPMLLLLGFSVFTFWKKFFQKALLLIWFFPPFFALALFGKVLYPRFIFFMTLSLLPLVALSLDKIYLKFKKPWLFLVCYLLCSALWFRTIFQLVTNPYRADIPRSDANQYLNDWPAGGGVNETIAFLRQESQKGKIWVGTEGTFGPLPYALEVYLNQNPDIEIRGFWPLREEIPVEATISAALKPSYFVFNQTQKIPEKWPLKLIGKYPKGVGKGFLQLFQVLPGK
jgi:hypothetical protein